jgi:hypothetical protein
MQVNQPVVDKDLMVLVPTQITPGRIRDTDRPMKFGVLSLNDEYTLDEVVDKKPVRYVVLKHAVESTYHGNIITKLTSSEPALQHLDQTIRQVAQYARRATFNCHH